MDNNLTSSSHYSSIPAGHEIRAGETEDLTDTTLISLYRTLQFADNELRHEPACNFATFSEKQHEDIEKVRDQSLRESTRACDNREPINICPTANKVVNLSHTGPSIAQDATPTQDRQPTATNNFRSCSELGQGLCNEKSQTSAGEQMPPNTVMALPMNLNDLRIIQAENFETFLCDEQKASQISVIIATSPWAELCKYWSTKKGCRQRYNLWIQTLKPYIFKYQMCRMWRTRSWNGTVH